MNIVEYLAYLRENDKKMKKVDDEESIEKFLKLKK